jgi:hypothetical protein
MTTLIPKFDLKNGGTTPTGAVNRDINTKLQEIVSVKDFGAVGDGTTDDTTAFNNALAASYNVYVPSTNNGYLLTSQITIPANTSLIGQNKQKTKLLHGYNGTMFNLADGASLFNLYIEGQGATYNGYGVYMSSTNGNQVIENCRIVNFSYPCIYFELTAGSGSTFQNIQTYQVSGGTGTGNVAIQIANGTQLTAVPRKFTQIETGGSCAFAFGGSSDTFVSDSFLGDLIYTSNSRGVLISGCRIANQVSLVIDGHNNTIIGCDVNPQITIASGSSADNIAIQGNSYNTLPIIDNSGNARNLIDVWEASYTPTITAGGTAFSLGNGTVSGTFTRQGANTTIIGSLTLGSTTSLGTGQLSISLPQQRWSGSIFEGGTVYMNRGGTIYSGFLQIAGSVTTAALLRDTTGSITYNSPVTFASGDIIRWSATYSN